MDIILNGHILSQFDEYNCYINNEYINFTLKINDESFRMSSPRADFERLIKHFPNRTTHKAH